MPLRTLQECEELCWGGGEKKERENFQGTSDGKLFARELDKFFLKLESQTEQDSSAHSLARFKKHHFGRRALKKPAGQMASLRNTGKRVDISTVTRLTAICGLSHRFQAPVERSYYTCTPPKKKHVNDDFGPDAVTTFTALSKNSLTNRFQSQSCFLNKT